MTTADDDVDALVLAAGRGERLGLGPKAWLVLGGRTLLERAVATMRAVSTRVIVGVSPSDVARAAAAVGADTTVLPGGTSRRETMAAAFRAGRAPVVLVHDVAHPFVTPALAREVIALARWRGAAVAAVRSTSSAYHEKNGAVRTRLGAGDLWLIRRPFACHRADLDRVLDAITGDEGLAPLLARVGVETQIAAAPSWNIKITGPEDWALARAIEQGLRPV